MKLEKKYIIPLIAIVVFLININTVFNDYCFDDNYVTNGHPSIEKGFAGIKEIFTSRYFHNENLNYGYRPIVQLSFIIEYELFGFNPQISHLINLILYIIICVILFNLLSSILKGKSPVLILFITLLFALHPLHTEVVASLKNRDEILSALFSLITIELLISYKRTNRFYLLLPAALVYYIALLSKISALIYIPISILTVYYVEKLTIKDFVIFIVFFLIIFEGYRLTVSGLVHTDVSREINMYENPLQGQSLLIKIYTGFVILFYYLRLIIYPHPLICYYGFDMIPVRYHPDFMVVLSFLFYVGIFIVAIIGLKKKRIYSYAILIYLFSLSIYMNIPKIIPGMLAERFTFFAILGFSIITGFFVFNILTKFLKNRKLFFIIICCLLLPYGIKTFIRNLNWNNNFTLFEHDIKYGKKSVKLNDLLASECINKFEKAKTYDEAIKYLEKTQNCYRRCLKIYPKSAVHWNDLGMIQYLYYNNYDSALYFLKKSIKYEPNNTNVLYNISQSCFLLNDTSKGLEYLNKILLFDSLHFKAINNLTNIYLLKKDFKNAEKNIRIMRRNYSSRENTYIFSANYNILRHDTINAIQNYEKALQINPENTYTLKVLVFLNHTLGRNDKAAEYQKRLETLEKHVKQ